MDTVMIDVSSYGQHPVSETGGKADALLRLSRQGFDVPPFIVLPVSFFEGLAPSGSGAVIRAVTALLPQVQERFAAGTVFAVRSSATVEDGLQHSFAGQFKTLLHVTLHDLPQAVAAVWLSQESDAVSAYREKMAHAAPVHMAVIVQEMIPATASGVAFGIHPVSGDPGERLVNAVTGTGDLLVNGSVNADTYILRAGGTETRPAGTAPVLTPAQLQQVSDALQRLQEITGTPCDMEFAFLGDRFFLLQSRPVTTQAGAERIVWDNSNIVESYPGLTLPLTFSFIEKMYAAVYRQLSLVLGVSRRRVARHEDLYGQMLGLLNGRVYYNLNSWYRALMMLPGYRINAGFMEQMMGVREKPDIPLPPQRRAGISDYLQVLRAVGCILYNLVTVRRQRRAFIRSFYEVYDAYEGKSWEHAGFAAIWADYRRFETMMVRRWQAPLVNDFFAMIYFGLLQKYCATHLPEDKDIHNRLIAASGDIITTEPLKRLPALAAAIAADEALKTSFLHSTPEAIMEQLQQPRFAGIRALLGAYIRDWGERCVAELKLETVTYIQDPLPLIAVLQSYVRKGIFTFRDHSDDNHQRGEAEVRMMKRLSGRPIAKMLFRHLLRQARYLISNRENLRYYRTKGFGMVRRMMLAMGERLHEQGILETPRDIFYLKMEELEALAAGGDPTDWQETVSARKADYRLFADLPLPERVVTAGRQERIVTAHSPQTETMTPVQELKGIPCSPGVVRARVKLVTHADAGALPHGQIMATYATDPGWVVLFPAAAGILTERGSLLSHAAIVSREMGIPCITGIEGLMQQLKDGDEVIMDGSTGIVKKWEGQ